MGRRQLISTCPDDLGRLQKRALPDSPLQQQQLTMEWIKSSTLRPSHLPIPYMTFSGAWARRCPAPEQRSCPTREPSARWCSDGAWVRSGGSSAPCSSTARTTSRSLPSGSGRTGRCWKRGMGVLVRCFYFALTKMQMRFTHPLFGPLGATIGSTMPTTPQSAVKMMNGTKDAPIVRNLRLFGCSWEFSQRKMATDCHMIP